MDQPFTLLIHGLHMSGLYMRPLAKKLNQAGFSTHTPSYRSLTKSISDHSNLLNDWLTKNHPIDQPINLVGHSLGGLVIRHFLASFGMTWQIHRCVTLGTPHQGSICANYANRLFPPLVKKAYPLALDGHCVPLPDNIELGIIAGNRPVGLGIPILSYHNKKHHLGPDARQHDGTVYLSETYLPSAKEHLILPVSHTGLITDETVAHQVIYFLKHGEFLKDST